MKKQYVAIITALFLAFYATGETIELTILENEKVKVEVENGTEHLKEKNGIEVKIPSFAIRKKEFVFLFSLNTNKKLKSIRIEEVSGNSPILILEDINPDSSNNYWSASSPIFALSKENLPWVFEKGDTTTIFRFTFITLSQHEEFTIHQPVTWKNKAKKRMRKAAR